MFAVVATLECPSWWLTLVTESVLLSALRRAVDGVRLIDALWAGQRGPDLTPGTTCNYCPALPTCDAGRA